jgi:hypothetical protein
VSSLPTRFRRHPKRKLSRDEWVATFKDLLSHYGLLSKFEAIMASRQVDAQSLLGFYGSLAGALLHEVPALSDPRRSKWDKGSELMDQARLVDAVITLQKEVNKTQRAVFDWLANENDPTGPEDAAKRMARLPARYRGRTNSGSLKVAYKAARKATRLEPYATRLKAALSSLGPPRNRSFPPGGTFPVLSTDDRRALRRSDDSAFSRFWRKPPKQK